MMEELQTLLQQEIDNAAKYINNVFNSHKVVPCSLQNIWDSLEYAIECSKIFYYETDLFTKQYSKDPILRWGLLCFKGGLWIRVVKDENNKNIVPNSKSGIEHFICSNKEAKIYKSFNKEFFKIR